jgi:uncharacterized protein (TIGR02145 family)
MKRISLCFLLLLGITGITSAQNFKTVKIADQLWMAENLNVNVPGSWYYNDDPTMGSKYGRLYSWDAANKACPAGWHLPSEKEWEQLIAFLGGEDVAGKHLKCGNSSGFNAVLGGLTSVGNYRLLDTYGTFWSSTSYDKDHAWYFYITSSGSGITKTYFTKNYGFSVRYVKNK